MPTPTTSRRPSTSTAACRGGTRSSRSIPATTSARRCRGSASRTRRATSSPGSPGRSTSATAPWSPPTRSCWTRRPPTARRSPTSPSSTRTCATARRPAASSSRSPSTRPTRRPRTPSTSTSPTRWRGWACEWVSLAPRFVGSFEKGIDYVGDVGALADDLAVHAAIARAPRPVQAQRPLGLGQVQRLPRDRRGDRRRPAPQDRGHELPRGAARRRAPRPGAAAAHLRARARALRRGSRDLPPVRGAPDPAAAPDLDDPAVRQVLHVTFGSVLASELGAELRSRLDGDLREPYADALAHHLGRHLAPFG